MVLETSLRYFIIKWMWGSPEVELKLWVRSSVYWYIGGRGMEKYVLHNIMVRYY